MHHRLLLLGSGCLWEVRQKDSKLFRSMGCHFGLDVGSNGSVSSLSISLRTFVASVERDS